MSTNVDKELDEILDTAPGLGWGAEGNLKQAKARIKSLIKDEVEQAHNSGYLKGVSDTNQAFVKASLHKEQTASSQTGDEE